MQNSKPWIVEKQTLLRGAGIQSFDVHLQSLIC